jgi:hypothetical protein
LFWRNKFSKSAIAGNAKPVSIEEITETTLTQMQKTIVICVKWFWDDDFIPGSIVLPIAKAKLLIHLL